MGWEPASLPAAPHPWSSCPSVKCPSLSPAPKFSSRLCGIFSPDVVWDSPFLFEKRIVAAALNPGSATECASQEWRGSGWSCPKEGPRTFQPPRSGPCIWAPGGGCVHLPRKAYNSAWGRGGSQNPHLPVLPLSCARGTRQAAPVEPNLNSERG